MKFLDIFKNNKPTTQKSKSAMLDLAASELSGRAKADDDFLYHHGFTAAAYDALKTTADPKKRDALMSSALMRSIEASDKSQAQDQAFLIRYGNKPWAQDLVRTEQNPIRREELAKKHLTKKANTKYPNLPQIAAQAIKTPLKPIQPAPLKPNTFANHADDVLVAMVRRNYLSKKELTEAQAELAVRGISILSKGFSKNTK
jgi:hypothetical protein